MEKSTSAYNPEGRPSGSAHVTFLVYKSTNVRTRNRLGEHTLSTKTSPCDEFKIVSQ